MNYLRLIIVFVFLTYKKNIRATSKAFKLIIINRHTGLTFFSTIQIITAENIPVAHLPGHPHTFTPTHILLTQPTYTHYYYHYHQPDTHTSLDPYVSLKPNQTATLVKPYRMVLKVVQIHVCVC